ncbi:antitoxin MazE [Algoriphagus alkaliphilus]|uniref:Antitoxin MazE n=1 Tax=Algoriphagus alkaliphilus TaxID=279824 RepID=A0A1G5ZNF7_9BACT|nr:AbrB/MazE/SpoVT family DNA-binding domain-containing protein [Algoriphagus alkaliphilus]MBA4300041.1 MazF family transcriptional regulator [Cyclobacterium sp.]SDA96152.1 antitoxin MazE [Algoriphagus alkaliphilus]
METNVIKIGNSKGVRLSKTILEKYQIGEKVEIILEDNQIVLKPIKTPRQGWAEAFKKMHENGDDELLIPDVFEDEDFEEWK